jgi:hypothetical protein
MVYGRDIMIYLYYSYGLQTNQITSLGHHLVSSDSSDDLSE